MRVVLKYAMVVLLLFLAAIVQMSLLPYASVLSAAPNLLFIIFFAILFFQKKQDFAFSFSMAVVTGFLLDAITPMRFGVGMAVLLMIYALFSALARFLQEANASSLLWYYLATFLGLSFAYYGLLYIGGKLTAEPIQLGVSTLISIAYSVVVAALIFFIYQKLFGKPEDNQLKLL